MTRLFFSCIMLVLFAAACVPVVNSSVESGGPTPGVPSILLPGERIVMQSASYSITVMDPARSLAELQQAVEQAGGIVTSASTWSGEGSSYSASLSAKVPPEALIGLGEVVRRMALEVQNGSTYIQDVTPEVRTLEQRQRELIRAQEQLFAWMKESRSRDTQATYTILSRLLENELTSVESQLNSYAGQADMASFDVSIYQPEAVSAIIE